MSPNERAALAKAIELADDEPLREDGAPAALRFERVWVKILGMLQQNWAGILTTPDGETKIYFFDDHGGIFDSVVVRDHASAERALIRNCFERFGHKHAEFLSCPGPSFYWNSHPGGMIYSSGKYWIPE
jgi:hypothetical protein